MSATAPPLQFQQRLGLIGWRAMMGTFGLLSRLRSPSTPGAVTEHAYGAHPDERLDQIESAAGATEHAPIVYIHGGGWICGKKEMYTGPLARFAEAGHPIFNLEYPLAPERPHPHMLRSLLRAIAWIQEQHPQSEGIHLMGDSAGGNLVAMLGILLTNKKRLAEVAPDFQHPTPRVRTIVSLYGVLDRLSWIEQGFPGASLMLHCYAGPGANGQDVETDQAITPMDLTFENLPPTFIAAGSKDQLAPSSALWTKHLQSRSHDVSYEVYDGEGHGFFNTDGPASQQLRSDILAFLARN